MDIVERLAQQAAETINGGEFYDGKWYTEGQRQAWRKAMAPAADEIERLREALDQALDDMGADGMSVCGATKAQMRYALGKNVDPEFDYYSLDRAISVLVSVGQFKSKEQAYEALGEKSDGHC
jgi:hypothetical protein